jgi:hypothetical protein
MMHVPPDQARRLTYWQFTALRYEWNARHRQDGDDGSPVEPPSEEFVRERQRELAEMGIAG